MTNISTYSEDELVQLLRIRDKKVFTYLYDHYCGALHKIVLEFIPDRDLAVDLLQDVFVKIYEKIDRYDPAKGTIFTWMLTLTRNMGIDKLRALRYQNSKIITGIPERAYFQGNGMVVNLNVNRIGLMEIVAQLQPEYRSLIHLAYFKGFTNGEIANLQKLPLGTVKSRMRGALKKLRQLLVQNDPIALVKI